MSFPFTALATDPDSDDITYAFDWGDGDTSSWSDSTPSGVAASLSHVWDSVGTYRVKAKAKDIPGSESDWSAGHSIRIKLSVPPETLQYDDGIERSGLAFNWANWGLGAAFAPSGYPAKIIGALMHFYPERSANSRFSGLGGMTPSLDLSA